MKKFDYFLHLRTLGIKEKDAISMVKQNSHLADLGAEEIPVASVAVMEFNTWGCTDEGAEYWHRLYRKHCAKEACE